MFLSAFGTSVICSLKSYKEKQKIFQEFNDCDIFIYDSFKCSLDYKTLKKQLAHTFITLWLISVSVFFLFLFFDKTADFYMFLYVARITTLAHIVHIQSFQLYIFSHAVQVRLKFIATFLNSEKNYTQNLKLVKNLLQHVYEIKKRANSMFKVPLMFVVSHNFSTLITNAYWTLWVQIENPWNDSTICKLPKGAMLKLFLKLIFQWFFQRLCNIGNNTYSTNFHPDIARISWSSIWEKHQANKLLFDDFVFKIQKFERTFNSSHSAEVFNRIFSNRQHKL